MKNLSRFLSTSVGAALLLLIVMTLVFTKIAKFPYKFIIIISIVILFTFLQNKNLKALNFKRLRVKDFGTIVLLFIIIEIVMDFIIQPFISHIFNEGADYESFGFIKGESYPYMEFVLKMWISAAIGEEIVFRAFLFVQLEKIIGCKKYLIVFISAVLFALPHWYQGLAGVITTFIFGIFFGLIYLKYKNIWINIIVHGLIDTLFLTLAYYGALSYYG